MFRITGDSVVFPQLYPRVERKLPTAKDKGWTKVGGFTLRDKTDFIPQPGLQENVCACEANEIHMCGAATMGKMQPYDAKVLTPNGFVDMGSLKIGDTISSKDGSTQVVEKIFEHGIKDVYKVTFDDGATTECGLEHLWSVAFKQPHYAYSSYETHTLEEIISKVSNGERAAIPFCKPIIFNSSKLPVKPYTLGALLGDGCCCGANIVITSDDKDIINRIESDGYKCTRAKYPKRCDYRIRRDGIWTQMEELGLIGSHSWDKHIPECYLMADIDARLELMQGLLDTDGHVDKLGHIEFFTVSEQLAKDVQYLVRSLGGRCRIGIKKTSYKKNGKTFQCRDCYILNINTQELNKKLVSLERKRERLLNGFRNGRTEMRHVITKIEKVGQKQCRCLLVSSPDHLYITDDFIVTHNTFTGILLWGYRANRKGASGAMISTRLQDSKKGSSIFRDNELVWGGYANCEYNTSDYPTFYWKKWGTAWRLIHSNFNTNNPVEWAAFVEYAKKNQNGYQYFDEANDLQEKQYHYWNSRNRDDSGVRPQSVYSYNPPGSNHYFTRNLMNGGYVGSDYYFKPEMNGVVRYYYSPTDNVDDRIWGDTPQEVALAANITLTEKDIAAGLTKMDMIRSFAAFTGEASDNRMLIASTGGKSVANLLYSGQGNVLKGGYFGDIESDEININRQMIHSLWENPLSEDENMYATMDISSGKTENDKAPMIIWRGLQAIALEFFSGSPKELEGWIDAMLKKWRVPVTNFAFDATGHGYWVQAFTDGIPITWNKRVMQEYDNNGNPIQTDEYFNLRSQLLGKTEVLIKSGLLSMAIPKDKTFVYGHKGQQRRFIDILFDEIDLFAITHKNKKIYYRSKDEFKDKYKFSPDITETISLRAVFELDARPKKQPKPVTENDAYDELYHRPPMRSAYGTFRRKIY